VQKILTFSFSDDLHYNTVCISDSGASKGRMTLGYWNGKYL